VFSPPGKPALHLDGHGEPIPYTDVSALTITCPTIKGTRVGYGAWTSSWSGFPEERLSGIGATAELADASNTSQYPASHTFFLAVRVGRRLAIVGVEAPNHIAAVDRSLMMTLARRVAANLSTG